MARPKQSRPITHYNTKLSLCAGEDDDLITWFESIPPRERAKAIVTALRQGGLTAVSVVETEPTELDAMIDLMVF